MAGASDVEEATWLAFLIAYLSPLEGDDPWASIAQARTSWASGELPMLEDVALGPRAAHDPARGASTLLAYRAWAERAGSQAQAFIGDPAWPDQRRFDRAFERLSLPGFGRAPRFELLVVLGRLGVYDVRPWSLQLSADALDPTVVASKRVLGIGDPLLLQRRAAELVEAVGVPIEALDLALTNWSRPEGERITAGATVGESDPPPAARRHRRGAGRRGALAVLLAELVNAGDGRSAAGGGVRPAAVVEADEGCQGAVALVAVGPDAAVRPFACPGCRRTVRSCRSSAVCGAG